MVDTKKSIKEILRNTAKADDRITGEESKVIAAAMKNAKTFDSYLKMAKQDGFIDSDERAELIAILNKIYESAQEQAKKDKFISSEETALLVKLSEFLQSVMKKEDLD